MERLLPLANIAIAAGACAVYAAGGDWRRAIYWAAAAVLQAAVTF